LPTLLLSGCSVPQGIKPSETTCDQFLLDLKGKHQGPAYNLLSSTCKRLTSPQQVQSYWSLVEKDKGKVQSWSPQGIGFYTGSGGSSIRLSYVLRGTKGNSSVQFSCIEENGKWLIQGFNFWAG